ncbi:MAG: glutathione S-transferase family protein [Pseudomonadota bacterium]|nr:glutathione S-transferase family protein [Pseudomonadota bacterium]
MLVIWGRKNSINVQKVLWCCEEMAVPYERRDAGGGFGIVNTPEYRRLNPNGLVPTIEDDGLTLWESNAIVRYLARKHGTAGLLPDDPAKVALADQWMDWKVSTFWPAIRPLFFGLVRTAPDQRDLGAIEAARVKTGEALGTLDLHLATHPFVAGNAFSMGDIPLGSAVWRWMALPIERMELPNVQRWFDSLAARAPFKQVVMHPLT